MKEKSPKEEPEGWKQSMEILDYVCNGLNNLYQETVKKYTTIKIVDKYKKDAGILYYDKMGDQLVIEMVKDGRSIPSRFDIKKLMKGKNVKELNELLKGYDFDKAFDIQKFGDTGKKVGEFFDEIHKSLSKVFGEQREFENTLLTVKAVNSMREDPRYKDGFTDKDVEKKIEEMGYKLID